MKDRLFIMLVIIYMAVRQAKTCGPGKGVHQKYSSDLNVLTRQPNINERSIHASGKFIKPLERNDDALQSLIATGIIFKRQEMDADTRKAIEVFLA